MAKNKTLYVPSNRTTASIFNYEMFTGLVSFNVLGAIIGGIIGKHKQQREINTGQREVKPPSFFNIDTLAGAGMGAIGGYVAGDIMSVQLGPAAGTLAGLATGVIAGGLIGEHAMRNDYAKAKNQAQMHDRAQQLKTRSQEQSVTPQMAAELEAKLAKPNEQSMVERAKQNRQAQLQTTR